MDDKIYHSLNEVFSDSDMYDLLSEPIKEYRIKSKHDMDIDNFKEIKEWMKEKGREPKKTDNISKERTLFNRLNGIRKNESLKVKLAPYDDMNLLKILSVNSKDNIFIPEKFDNIEDALNGLTNILDFSNDMKQVENDLIDTRNVKKPIKIPDKIGSRVVSENFDEFEPLFKKVQSEIASSRRKVIDFKNYDIKSGRFYVLKGLLTYIDVIGEEFLGSDNQMNARMHVIFENGTESQMLRRAFGASMYSRGGKIVTEIENGEIKLQNDILTGSIYVLKSLSNNPVISSIKNLYKVGFTDGSVSKRISNAKNESTYLYADVEVIEDFQIYNVDVHGFETLLHHRLSDMQLQVEIESPNGGVITPKEWFVISYDNLVKTINEIIVELQK